MKQRLIWSITFLAVIVLLMVAASCGSAAKPTPTPSTTQTTLQTPITTQSQSASVTPPTGATTSPSETPTSGNSTNPGFPAGGAGRGANGTLTKIDGNTLTLTTSQGQVTVNVDSNTSIQKTVIGTLSDLTEGESLTVIGSQDANGNITATSIMTRPQGQSLPFSPTAEATPNPRFPAGGSGRGTNGTLTKINGNTLTLTTVQGQVTVNVSSDTSIQKTMTGTLSDLKDGESLTVAGSRDTNGNITAASIMIRPQGQSVPFTPTAGATVASSSTVVVLYSSSLEQSGAISVELNGNNRFTMGPGETHQLVYTLNNLSSQDVTVPIGYIWIPSTTDLSASGPSSVTIPNGQSATVKIVLTAANSLSQAYYHLSIAFGT